MSHPPTSRLDLSALSVPDFLETERLILRRPTPEDGVAINAALHASWGELQQWMAWAQGDPPPVEETVALQHKAAAQYQAREEFHFNAFLKETGAFVAKPSLLRIAREVPKGEIGYWIDTRFSGRGLITEAVLALTAFGLETLKLARIEIRCDATNVRSAAVAERAGFPLEGRLLNEARDPQGALRDTLVFARISGPL